MEKKEICSKNGNRPIDYVLIWANYILWIAIILFCLLFAMVGHCATGSNSEIPFNTAADYTYNTCMTADGRLEIAIQTYFNTFNFDPDGSILVFSNDGYFNDYWFQYIFIYDPYCEENYIDNYDYTNPDGLIIKSDYDMKYVLVGINGNIGGTGYNLGTSARLCGSSATSTNSFGTFTPRYPFYYNGDPILSANGNEIIISRTAPVIVTGHATEPNLTDNDIDPTTKPDIDDYLPTPTTPPTVDTTSPSTLLNSIFDLLSWGFNLLNNTIKGTLTFLGDLLSYVGQKIIDNIKNGIKNLYDNFKSLFEPLLNGIAEILSGLSSILSSIKEDIDFIIKPFDQEEFEESWNNCQFISAVENIQDGYDEFKKAFQYAEERDYYTLYMGFMFTDYTVNAEFDFTWLYPLRPIYRPLLWGFVIYEMFVYMCSSFSDWIAGRSGNK